jgi:hypothetical protein
LKPDKKRGNTSLHQQLEKPRLFYGLIIAAVAFDVVYLAEPAGTFLF